MCGPSMCPCSTCHCSTLCTQCVSSASRPLVNRDRAWARCPAGLQSGRQERDRLAGSAGVDERHLGLPRNCWWAARGAAPWETGTAHGSGTGVHTPETGTRGRGRPACPEAVIVQHVVSQEDTQAVPHTRWGTPHSTWGDLGHCGVGYPCARRRLEEPLREERVGPRGGPSG